MNKILLLFITLILVSSCGNNDEAKKLIVKELNEGWDFRQHDLPTFYPVKVPGSVHTDLMALRLIDDPYYRLNEKELQWIDKKDWDYRLVFDLGIAAENRDRKELVFEGLDTYARITLNGQEILQTDNMFRTWTVDVTNIVKPEGNEMRVCFDSPTRRGKKELEKFGFQLAADNDQSENGEMGADRVSPYIRKAPYHFGWDWGPRLVTSGIWRPVKLRAWSNARIENVNMITRKISGNKAELSAEVEIEVIEPGDYFVSVLAEIIGNSPRNSEPPQRISARLEKGLNSISIPVEIKDPVLWQPNGSGDQALYHFTVELSKGKKLIDARKETTGLRTVRLVQDPDPDRKGRSFYFEVNGQPVFAKGANYIPNDVFLSRVSPEKYEYIIRSAAEANMNMLRVWGGGIYENDIFYDLCDQYGIMVWQDFMFACAMYPGNDEFLENVRLEAIDNVKRLRNHPCIVLWCGNNEIEAAWGPYDEKRGWGWKQRYTPQQREIIWKAYDTLFHKILPGVIAQEDPARPYWHSSPSAGMGELASYDTPSGDMHYWGVWHGLHPFTDFSRYKSRFMSEYGFQSFPEFNSVKKYIIPEDYSIESEVMMAHQRSGIGNLRIKQYMTEDYIIPADFEQFLYVGQLLQAEAIKLAIESHRADMPYCMGSLYWQINDCWPVASWSGIDYYGKWKAMHYFVKEAYKPQMLVVSEQLDSVRISIVSDKEKTGKMTIEILGVDFMGNVLYHEVIPPEMTSRDIISPTSKIFQNIDKATVVLVSRLKDGHKVLDQDLHYFVKPKDLKLVDPQIQTSIIEKEKVFEISVSAKYLAKNVFLYAEGLEEQFSDNFFDVLPGENVKITIPKNEKATIVLREIKVLSLYQTAFSHKITKAQKTTK